MSAIQIDIRDKTYIASGHEHRAIENLNLLVNSNEFVCLVGPSGCGKTTLLNIVAGLDEHYQGRINIGLGDQPPHIGYIFQNPRLLPWYTVRQNIELVFEGSPPADLIDALLLDMQLQEVQHTYPEHLSLGMQRRVAIIRAFAINPDILLMDEPFVSLDAPTARQVRNQLYSLWRQRPHTVLFVTHDLREAIALADRLIFLSSAPMKIINDIVVGLSRSERDDAAKIERFREHLLNNFPDINILF